jgi:hypothetical protein
MKAFSHIIRKILTKKMSKVTLSKYDELIQTFSADGPREPFRLGIPV